MGRVVVAEDSDQGTITWLGGDVCGGVKWAASSSVAQSVRGCSGPDTTTITGLYLLQQEQACTIQEEVYRSIYFIFLFLLKSTLVVLSPRD